MEIGVYKLTVHIPENRSLKGKRRIISSICTRVRNKFNVSIAEVDNNEKWQMATLGIACATNSSRHADKTLSEALEFIECHWYELEVISNEKEILSGF